MRYFALVAALLLGGCCYFVQASSDPMTAGAVEFDPPLAYARLWGNMERCTGTFGDFDQYRFFIVPRTWLTRPDSTGWGVAAVHYPENHRIYIAWPYLQDSLLVEHEMLHALGFTQHRYDVFVTWCHVETDSTILGQDHPVGLPPKLAGMAK